MRRVNDLAAHLYLAREKKLDAAMMEDLVDRRSGLLGISGQRSRTRCCRELQIEQAVNSPQIPVVGVAEFL